MNNICNSSCLNEDVQNNCVETAQDIQVH